jgi:hypothetical protein
VNGPRIRLATVVLVTAAIVAASPAAEPEVAFGVKDGWVEMTLTRDDRPVPDARIKVFDHQGGTFADGETGPDGRGEFPLPPGDSFRVEIVVEGRTADPIPLTRVDDHVVPGRVLLSFGLSPCCKVPKRGRASGPEPPGSAPVSPGPGGLPVWGQAVCGVAFTLAGIAILWLGRRGRPSN